MSRRGVWARLGVVVVAPLVALLVVGGATRVEAGPITLYDSVVDGGWRTAQGSSWLAQSFSTGASPVRVTGVRAWLRNANESNSGSVATSFSISVWSSSAGVPVSLLGTVASNVAFPAWSENSDTHVPGSVLSLPANGTYFVVVAGGAGGTTGWKCNTTAVGTDVSPTPSFSSLMSANAGSTWSTLSGACAGQHFSLAVTGATQSESILSGFADVSAVVGDGPISITAPSSSTSGSFTYTSSDPAVASVTGGQLTFVGQGSATITASFTPADDVNFAPASTSMTVTVTAAPPPTTTSTTVAPSTTVPPATTTTSPGSTTTPVVVPSTASTSTTSVAPPVTTVAGTASTDVPVTTATPPSSDPPSVDAGSRVPGPAPSAPSDNIFGDGEGQQVTMHIDASVGDAVGGAAVLVRGVALEPSAAITVTLFSEPQVLLRSTVGESGTFEAVVSLPDTLEPGRHTVVAEAVTDAGPVQLVGAFIADAEGRFEAIAQPAVLSNYEGPTDERLERALELGRPVYDVNSRPLTTAALVVAATSLLAVMGSVGGGPTSSGRGAGDGETSRSSKDGDDGGRRRRSRGKLAGVVTKKLKGLQVESSARGDLSATWAMPATAITDEFSRAVPGTLGRWSAMAPRIFVDGAWLRAMFGSFGFAAWVVGGVLGVCASFVGTTSPMVPVFSMLLALVVLGVFDAAAGAVAWLVLVLLAVVGGDVSSWPDVRTALGLGLLLSSISLLAHVIRPLRRYVAENSFERWERVLDYVVMPVFVAFAAGSMLKALNGLSGLELVSSDQVSITRWVVIVATMLRLAVEDVAAHLYPQRMRQVQPAKLVSPGRGVTSASIVMRSLVFLMIAEPFFGVTATTMSAAVLLAVPAVLKMWEDDLPNSARLHKWLPRGHFRFFCLLVLGAYMTASLIGPDGGPEHVRSSFIWMLLPTVVVGVVELFARSGGNWPSVALKRSLGAVTWTVAVGMVTGAVVLF